MNLLAIQRARQVLVVTAVGTAVIVALEFPFHQLTSQRGAIAKTTAELRAVEGENSSLRTSISSLRRPSTIAAIAHREYGLVRPGQRSFVILPAVARSGSRTSAGTPLSGIDLGGVAQVGLRLAPARHARTSSPSLWTRFLDRLEFWR